jgi:hypothetical protein
MSPRRLTQIVLALARENEWRGSSQGFTVQMKIAEKTLLEKRQYVWKIRVGNWWCAGSADTVKESFEQMEKLVANARAGWRISETNVEEVKK